MKDLIRTMVVLVAVALLMTAGCEEKTPPRDMRVWDTLETQNDILQELAEGITFLRDNLTSLETQLKAARDVNGINLNLLKRVSSLETSDGLYGHNYMDNKARLDNLEAGTITTHGLAGKMLEAIEPSYDPNDPIYKFIPEAGDDWKKTFGDTDDTRMKHTISEIRVMVAQIGQRLLVLENLADPNESVDPNEVKQ